MTSVARGAVLVGAAVLLVSMGGAIVAAPVVLPLLYLAARTSTARSYRGAAGVVAALTAAEVGWAMVYVVAQEATPWIWLAPSAAGVVMAALMARPPRPA